MRKTKTACWGICVGWQSIIQTYLKKSAGAKQRLRRARRMAVNVAELTQQVWSEKQSAAPSRPDIVEWVERACFFPERRTKEPAPIRLQEHQKRLLRAAADQNEHGNFRYRIVVACHPKRFAKSFTNALYGLWRSANFGNQLDYCLANSREQAYSTIFAYMRRICLVSPLLLEKIGGENIGKTFIEFPNGSRIEALPCSVASVSGVPVDLLQNTEVREIPDREVLDMLMSQTEGPNAQTFLDSSASDEENILYELKEQAENGAGDIFFDYIEGKEDDHLPWWSPGYLQSRKRILLPQFFRQWHLNQFGGSAEKFFPDALIAKMMDERVPMRCTREWLQDFVKKLGGKGFAIGGGLDRSAPWNQNQRDETCWTSVAKISCPDGAHYVLLDENLPPLNSEARLKEIILRLHGQWHYWATLFEQYQAGDLCLWAQAHGVPALICHAQGADQANAFAEFHSAASEGRVHICPQRLKLRGQLQTFKVATEGGKPKFGTAKGRVGEGQRRILDDMVYSLVWAIYALREVSTAEVRIRWIGGDDD
jgi:hypothetical protein